MSRETLEAFALKSQDQGGLTGVSIAIHGIPDAFLLMHVGVGCKHKATSQLSTHDWGADVVSRAFAPGAGIDEDPVTGSAHSVLTPYWAARLGRDAFAAYQASARGGHVGCRLAGDMVELTGNCVTTLVGDFLL